MLNKTYEVKIEELPVNQEIPITLFRVLETKINGAALEVFIEYYSQGNLEVRALLGANKLYLVGGKIDEPKESGNPDFGIQYTLAKVNRAWLSIDLAPFKKIENLQILKRKPETFARGEGIGDSDLKITDAEDVVLLKVIFRA